jgi:hypothetical protein
VQMEKLKEEIAKRDAEEKKAAEEAEERARARAEARRKQLEEAERKRREEEKRKQWEAEQARLRDEAERRRREEEARRKVRSGSCKGSGFARGVCLVVRNCGDMSPTGTRYYAHHDCERNRAFSKRRSCRFKGLVTGLADESEGCGQV